jgi:hypothetical protein
MKILKFNQWLLEGKKPKGAPDWHDSDAPDAEGRFRDLSIKDLAAWLIKTRKSDLKRISGSLTQQVVFNRNDDPEYAEKMEKTRKEVYRQLGREDLLKKESLIIKEENRISRKPGQHTGSSSHSDLFTDEDPKGTIHGLGFKDEETAKKGIEIIKSAKRTHAHKVQATLVMVQRGKSVIENTKDPEKKRDLIAANKIWTEFLEELKKETKNK